MTAFVFVDTSVFVYERQADDLRKQGLAAQWLERLWLAGTGRTSPQVLCEFYATLTRKLDPPVPTHQAWEHIRSLLAWNPQPVDADVLVRGFEIGQRYRLNWWDCLIVASAQVQRCSVLLTEDLQDGAVFDAVTVRSPFTLGASEDIRSYAAHEPTVSRHRRRGRPRKIRDRKAAAG